MLTFEVLHMKDLAAVDAIPFGKAEASSQRFVIQSAPVLRRQYTVLVRGATTPGPKIVEFIGGEGAVIGASDPFMVPPEIANNITLNLRDVIAPAVGEFTLRMRDAPEFLVQPPIAAAPAAESAPESAAAPDAPAADPPAADAAEPATPGA